MKTKLLLIVTGIAVLTGSAFYGWHNKESEQQTLTALNAQEKKSVSEILTNKKPYCIGNYSIELPDRLVPEPKTEPVIRFDDMNITTQRLYFPPFEQRIHLREDELRKTKPVDPRDGSYLKAVYPLAHGEKGVIFERMESVSVPDSERVLETHLYKDDVAFIIELKARNETSEKYNTELKQHPELGGNSVPQNLDSLNRFIQNISGRDDNQSLSTPDICIPNASLSTNGLKGMQQNITLTLASNKYPQLSVILEFRNHSPDDQSLLSFRRYAEPIIEKSGGYVIRKGNQDINGLDVQEWLAKDFKPGDKEHFDFYLLINGEEASETKPVLFVNLMWEQNPKDEKLTDNQVLEIWNEIIKTIRYR